MTNATTERESYSLRADVHVATSESGQVHLIRWPHTGAIGVLTPTQRSLLRRLAQRSYEREELRRDGDGEADQLLDRLLDGGWVRVTVRASEADLYTLEPRRASGRPCPPYRADRAALSPYATITPSNGQLTLAVPHGAYDVRLRHAWPLGIVHQLAGGATVAELVELTPPTLTGNAETAVRRLLGDLAQAGVLHDEEAAAGLAQRQWTGHELWFHVESRLGHRRTLGSDIGRIGRFDGILEQPPALRAPAGPAIELERPDLTALRDTDPTLTAALEDRRSWRQHDPDNPLTLEQLGEFLYRCTSTRRRTTPEGEEGLGRPYPSGGASYELEFYPLVHHVAGLAPGLYRYDQHGHRLEQVSNAPSTLRRITGVNQTLQSSTRPPQVLIIIAARFGRVMYRYEAFGYAVTLKNVGVALQVMYLVATAMGLAGCAVGAGESDEFCAAVGTDPLEESPVGEFMLGSRPPGRVVDT